MSTYPPPETQGQIVPFRRRGAPIAGPPPPVPSGPAKDLAEFEQLGDDGPDEYRHRMKMNGLAALALLVLIVIGWWIVETMIEVRDNQNCALSGRKNCETIVVPPPG